MSDSGARQKKVGVACALGAYVFWGFVPIYYKAVAHIPVLELLAHRCVWSLLLTTILILMVGGWRDSIRSLRTRRARVGLFASTALVATNWPVFMWAIANDRVLEASLGYYINPLISILLGFVFLGERLRKLQLLSVLLATAGVAVLTVAQGVPPWVALALACSFGTYGLLRKISKVGSLVGLNLETLLLMLPALVYLASLSHSGTGHFGAISLTTDLLLAFAGVATAVPLLLFTSAARRLRLSTVGFLQFLAPSIHFLLAVWLYGESFTTAHAFCFGSIWAALTLYLLDAMRSKVK